MNSDTSETGREILRSIRRIIRSVDLQSKRLSKDSGLTLPQILVMRSIESAEGGQLTVAGISGVVQLSSPTVSGILDRLERQSLVSRHRGESDRRKVWLTLTEAGQAKLAETPAPLQDRFVQRVATLSTEEQRQMLDVLERVVGFLDAEAIDASPILVADPEMKKA